MLCWHFFGTDVRTYVRTWVGLGWVVRFGQKWDGGGQRGKGKREKGNLNVCLNVCLNIWIWDSSLSFFLYILFSLSCMCACALTIAIAIAIASLSVRHSLRHRGIDHLFHSATILFDHHGGGGKKGGSFTVFNGCAPLPPLTAT